jgi:hypothetical protein
MAKRLASVTVVDLREIGQDPSPTAFKVKAMNNIIRFQIDEYLSEEQVQRLINEGVNVSVKPWK